MFALLECVCEPTLSHQTASIKPLQKCGPYMSMAVLFRDNPGPSMHKRLNKAILRDSQSYCAVCMRG